MSKLLVERIRMADNGIPPTEENMEQLEFWGMLKGGKEIRLYFFDEDKPTPEGFVPIQVKKGIMPVTLVAKTEDL